MTTKPNLKTYLAVFTRSPTSNNHKAWTALSADEQKSRAQKGMAAWMDWAAKNHSAISNAGGPLGPNTRIDHNGVKDAANNLAGFTIVQAASKDEAAALFKNHPHFSIFPGDGVELMEIMPIPETH
jgi:hypothetical protein